MIGFVRNDRLLLRSAPRKEANLLYHVPLSLADPLADASLLGNNLAESAHSPCRLQRRVIYGGLVLKSLVDFGGGQTDFK